MYRIIELEQNTPEWLDFRSSHIGGSDAPIICGLSPWCSMEELYLKKTGFGGPDKPMTSKMQRGHDLEPVARELLYNQTGIKFNPIVVESIEYPFISCSLDGISPCGKVICEIKCPNLITHEEAIIGHVPVYYQMQIQHALMVTGAEYCIYYSYRPEHMQQTALVEIFPNQELIAEILRNEIDFWDRVVNLRMPDGLWKLKKKENK